jgi:hypothetical protein
MTTKGIVSALSYARQTLTLNGVQHYGETSEGAAASLDYSWSYSITIRRVP